MRAGMNRGSSAPVIKLKPTLGLCRPATPAASSAISAERAQQAAGDGPPNQTDLTLSVGAKAMVSQAVSPRHEALGCVTRFRDICHHKGVVGCVQLCAHLLMDPQPWSQLRAGRNHSFRSGFLQRY